MPTHRFRDRLLSQTRPASLRPSGFIAFPLPALPGVQGAAFPVQELYRLAFDEATRATSPQDRWGDLRN